MFPVMFALEICDVEFSDKHDFDIYVSKFYKPDL